MRAANSREHWWRDDFNGSEVNYGIYMLVDQTSRMADFACRSIEFANVLHQHMLILRLMCKLESAVTFIGVEVGYFDTVGGKWKYRGPS